MNHDGYHLGFMFKKKSPSSLWESLVSKMIRGVMVHVDMLFVPKSPAICSPAHEHQPRFQTMRELFSTFVGEHFRGYVPRGWSMRTNDTHGLILIPVSEEKWDRARNYVSQLCTNKTAYNYTDLPFCSMSNYVINTIATDARDSTPPPKTVFCSQAALLTLRYAFDTKDTTAETKSHLATINSRGCSPMTLYMLLTEVGVVVDVDAYVGSNVIQEYGTVSTRYSVLGDDDDDGVWVSPSREKSDHGVILV